MTARTILPVVVMLAATGCTGVAPQDPFGLAAPSTASVFGADLRSGRDHTIAHSVPVASALARLPKAAGSVLDVRERRRDDHLEQRIIHRASAAGRGENALTVSMHAAQSAGRVPTPQPSEAVIAREMRQEFPSMTMRFGDVMHSNAYGPFGHATGTTGGMRCIYAWQQVRGRKIERRSWQRAGSQPTLNIRLRHCAQNASEQALVALMRGLAIDADPARLKREAVIVWSAGPERDRLAEGTLSTAPAESAPETYQPQPDRKTRRTQRRVAAKRTAATKPSDGPYPAVTPQVLVPLPGDVAPPPVTALPTRPAPASGAQSFVPMPG